DQRFECDDVLVAVGQENAFPWIERDSGIGFDKSGMPVVDKVTMQSTQPKVFFGGDSAFGPKNIIWAVAHGHDAAISLATLLNGEQADLRTRLTAPARNPTQDLYVSGPLKTGKIMAKDEDVCLHCGLCAERCPTGAWDMQKFLLDLTHAGHGCRTPQKKAA